MHRIIAEGILFRPRGIRSIESFRAFRGSKSFGTFRPLTSIKSRVLSRPSYSRPRVSQSPIFRRTYSRPGRDGFETHGNANRAVWVLIGLNVAVFGTWQYAIVTRNRNVLEVLGQHTTLSVLNIEQGRWYTLLTCAFSHQDLAHLAFNMFALNAFGSILAWVPGVGAVHVISLAVGSAILGSLTWINNERQSVKAASREQHAYVGGHFPSMKRALGASGMVQGMGSAAACLMPLAPMNLFFIPIAIPLWVITSAYVAVDAYYLNSETSRIGHASHLGGAAYGVLYYLVNLRNFGGVWRMLGRR